MAITQVSVSSVTVMASIFVLRHNEMPPDWGGVHKYRHLITIKIAQVHYLKFRNSRRPKRKNTQKFIPQR